MSELTPLTPQQQLDLILRNQEQLLTLSKKHIELYTQQMSKSDELNQQLLALQQAGYQSQKIALTFAVAITLAVGLFFIIS